MEKIAACPHCGTKKGFEVYIRLGGHQIEKRKFNGRIITIERNETDDVDNFVRCLWCQKLIETDQVNIEP